jgi:hypothetical protein
VTLSRLSDVDGVSANLSRGLLDVKVMANSPPRGGGATCLEGVSVCFLSGLLDFKGMAKLPGATGCDPVATAWSGLHC